MLFPFSIFVYGAYFNSGVSVRLRSPALPAFTLYFACHVTQLCTETELTDLGGESQTTWSGSGRLISTLSLINSNKQYILSLRLSS